MLDVTKKITVIFLIMFCAFIIKAQNLILNGSFEQHSVNSCYESLFFNSWNTKVSYSTSYGHKMEIHSDSCEKCIPSMYWGGGVQHGNWMVLMRSKPFNFPTGSGWAQSRFSLQLNAPLSGEKNYKLSFYVKDPPPPSNDSLCDNPLNNSIRVGISNTDTIFGSHLYTSPLGDSIWKQYSVVFNTQNAEEYLTVKIDTGNINNKDIFVDNFVLVETTEQPNAVYEVNGSNKKLVKVVDILGKEANPKQKGILFYIYSDGSVEKKVFVE